MKTFNRRNLGGLDFKTYKKKTTTLIARIEGEFEVETLEGRVVCPDGYLAIDSQGWPYPVAKKEFDTIYVEVG